MQPQPPQPPQNAGTERVAGTRALRDSLVARQATQEITIPELEAREVEAREERKAAQLEQLELAQAIEQLDALLERWGVE